MEQFCTLLKELGINFESGRVDDEKLKVVVQDDSGCNIAEFWFDDTVDADFIKVKAA